VFVGFDGLWEETETSNGTTLADISQQFAYLGNTAMFEELTIYCIAQGWSGTSDLLAVLDQAMAMFHGVETVLRTDPTLGIDGSVIAGLDVSGQLRAEYDAGGNVAVRVPFTIKVETTLLSTAAPPASFGSGTFGG
jgi:hypothetical protein